jgi:hypothetical protein
MPSKAPSVLPCFVRAMHGCAPFAVLFFAHATIFATTVKNDGTPLRSSCSSDANPVATLAAGTEVSLRFALAGESVPCYKVAAEVEGKRVEGYLPASAIDQLDSFDKSRKSAAWIDVQSSSTANRSEPAANTTTSDTSASALKNAEPIRVRATPAAVHVKELLEHNRTEEALTLVDAETKHSPDAGLLAMAAIAAMETDQNRRALDYFRMSLDIEKDPAVETTYKQLLREVNADQSITKLYGINVVLRYDGDAIPVETARQMLTAVDETLLHVSQQLGCRTEEKIITIVQTWAAYKQARGAVEWSAAMYDGRIRVPMEKGKPLNAETRKSLAHETTHACLSMFGSLPLWLHEGLAQKLAGEDLSPNARRKMAELARKGELPSLGALRNAWGDLTEEQARYAYAEALLAVELLMKDFGNDGLRNLLRNPERIPAISAELDKRLAQ